MVLMEVMLMRDDANVGVEVVEVSEVLRKSET